MRADLIKQLRNPSDGWTGDAVCVDAEIAAEAANEIERQGKLVDEHNAKLTCMCGSLIEEHGMGDGHSPVSMFDYAVAQEAKRLKLSSFTSEEVEEEHMRRVKARLARDELDSCT